MRGVGSKLAGMCSGCTTAIRKPMRFSFRRARARLVASAADLKRPVQVRRQPLARSGCVGFCRHGAPDRLRPGRVVLAPRDDMDMELRHYVAECGDVELVAGGDALERRAGPRDLG